MVVYILLFAVMWKYAPADEAEEDEEADTACCSLLSGGAAASTAHPGAPSGSLDGKHHCDCTTYANAVENGFLVSSVLRTQLSVTWPLC
jgi:hypothetical protein